MALDHNAITIWSIALAMASPIAGGSCGSKDAEGGVVHDDKE
jgi:hypothetical protein